MVAKLTDALIRTLPAPQKNSKVHYDAAVKGFGVRVTVAGIRSFLLNYLTQAGRERRYTIGRCDDWTTTDARREAKRLRQLIDQGGDPLADIEGERAAPTVVDLLQRYRDEHLPRLRLSVREDYERMIRSWIAPHFGSHTKVQDVVFADVDALHRKITRAGYPYRANRVIAMLGKLFSLAVRWGMRSDNPVKGVERNVEHYRRRYLSGDELERLIEALNAHSDQQAANIFRILLMTGARRGEALAMKWADVDLSTGKWSKPASSTKQNRAHEAPLSAPVRQLLNEIRETQPATTEFVFPGGGSSGHRASINKDWKRLTKAAGIVGLRIHDLRHSFASHLVSGGASLPLIGALLGHSNPTTTARYAHLYDDPQRQAVERVGAIITGKASAEIVPLKKGGAS